MVLYALIAVVTVFQYLWHQRQTIEFNKQANLWLQSKLSTTPVEDDDLLQKERPMRIINQILIGFPEELLREVSASATQRLRPIVKLPMLLICLVCGI